MEESNLYFDEFKPIRNKIRGLNFSSALSRLHELSQRKPAAIVPEIAEFLYVCAVVYANGVKAGHDEKLWNKIVHESLELNNRISAVSMEKGLWKWLRAMSLNQLKSHNNYYFHAIYRYYSIFSEPKITAHIEKHLGISYKAYFICGLWLHSVFSKKLSYPKRYFTGRNNGGPLFSTTNMEKTLELLAIPFAQLQAELKTAMTFNEDLFNFQAYPHVVHPIFEDSGMLFCMFPDHLLKQLIAGIYYAAAIGDKASHVATEFGVGFEKYVGTVLNLNNERHSYRIYSEITYAIGKNKNLKSSDWIIETDDAIVFIECKTKRPSLSSKKIVDLDEKGPEDVAAIAKAVSQLYKVYEHYKANKIPSLIYDPDKTFYPFVITLEEWFAGSPDLNDTIVSEVKSILTNLQIATSELEASKFRISSINTFETDIQQMFYLGFVNYFSHLSAGTLSEATANFVWKPYFEDKFEELFIKPYESFRDAPL